MGAGGAIVPPYKAAGKPFEPLGKAGAFAYDQAHRRRKPPATTIGTGPAKRC